MKESLISVIVPVYNTEDYLRPCIESILRQTYPYLQIILVNDGSTDHSGEICDEYKLKDSRIEVIHQENGGVSIARNIGMKLAKGEYVSFIDSDDYIHPQMYEFLLQSIKEDEYSFSMVLGKRVYDYNNYFQHHKLFKKHPLTQEQMIKGLFNSAPVNGVDELQMIVVWNKLYKRELLEEELFRKTGTEDTEFNCRIYLHAHQAILIEEAMYYWVQRSSSITHQ
ncbi:MAG: glycosyltransferase family 2 protein, partial [Lachnospiraceae bacterium]